VVACDTGTTGAQLVQVLHLLSEFGIDLIPPDCRWIFDPMPEKPPPPQITPLPHPVDLNQSECDEQFHQRQW